MKFVIIFGLSIVLAVAWRATAYNIYDGFGLAQKAFEALDPADHPALVTSLLNTALQDPALAPLRCIVEVVKDVALGDVPGLVLDAINVACQAGMSLGIFEPLLGFKATADDVGLVLKSGDCDVRASMSQAEDIWCSPQFRQDLPLVIAVHGFLSDMDVLVPDIYIQFTENFKCRGGYNIMVVDLGDRLDTFYAWAAYNTKLIGQFMGSALAKLVKKHGYTGEIHLFGHSLGAHISAAAGLQYTAETGALLSRVTGMDPAGPCYFGVGGPIVSFTSDCAAFVDVVHTSVVGHNVPIGHADFFVNGLVPVQPGCLSVYCSHERSWQFEFETIVPGQEDNFRAVKCASSTNLGAEACTGKSIRFGFGVPSTARGVYYVKTNEQSPFGPFAKLGFTPVCVST